ncbi:MAG: hypothetical protein FWG79_08460 [Bacteroidales bacterium]|nr:hypothetical protein [Bacteroidales bacterium]
MPFIKTLTQFRSVSIVGMAKNTGKTTCLNYVIRRLHEEGKRIALTSIGVDGEERDVLYDTPKPRIVLEKGMVFVTSEKDFEQRECPAEVLSVSDRATPLGRLITARAEGSGKVVLSGPSDSAWLQTIISIMPNYGVELTLVDGALSRMSLASPAVTDAMILCTGAACSPQLEELVRRTKFRCTLIELEQVEEGLRNELLSLDDGVYQISVSGASPQKTTLDEGYTSHRLPVTGYPLTKLSDSVFTLKNIPELSEPQQIYISGAVTDDFFKLLNTAKTPNPQLIIGDFTKLFITPTTYNKFIRNGGRINVLQKAKLLAVCTNPTSPEGTGLDPLALQQRMQEALGVPVYDVKREV